MWAAQEGHAAVAEFLLQQGAQVDFPDEVWTYLAIRPSMASKLLLYRMSGLH